jgi:gluconokinase
MGVSGSGKSAVGRALAAALLCDFQDGDDLHPAANRAKMAAGEALTDADRGPWLAAVEGWIDQKARRGAAGVVACSALRRVYRDQLTRGRPQVRIVFLEGSRDLIAQRLAGREGHFMPASLLDSQLATLEPPAPSEGAVVIDIAETIDRQVAQIRLAATQTGHPAANLGR